MIKYIIDQFYLILIIAEVFFEQLHPNLKYDYDLESS